MTYLDTEETKLNKYVCSSVSFEICLVSPDLSVMVASRETYLFSSSCSNNNLFALKVFMFFFFTFHFSFFIFYFFSVLPLFPLWAIHFVLHGGFSCFCFSYFCFLFLFAVGGGESDEFFFFFLLNGKHTERERFFVISPK